MRQLGMYVATVQVDEPARRDDEEVVMYNEPGSAIAVHPSTRRPVAAFMFRSRARIDPRDNAAAA